MIPFTSTFSSPFLEIEKNMKKLLKNIKKSVVKIYICDIITNIDITENSDWTAFSKGCSIFLEILVTFLTI